MRDWKEIVRERVAHLDLEPTAECDLVEEFAQHLDDVYRELLNGNASEAEAYAATLSELQDTYPLEDNYHRTRRAERGGAAIEPGERRATNPADELWRNIRYTLRSMRRTPVFTLFVLLTLALGIGANTTVFTVINTLILNPLPVPDSASLVAVNGVRSGRNAQTEKPLPLAYADFSDYRNGNSVFVALAAFTPPRGVTWQTGTSSQGLFAELVSGNYFSTMAISPALGRFFRAEEDGTAAAHAVAVMNYGTWQSRFGGSADILGKTLRLNDTVFTIVGVAPPRFIGVNGLFGPDVWVPAAMTERLFPVEMKGALTDRTKTIFQGVGRLKRGETRDQARANLTSLAANLAHEYPATNQGLTISIRPVRDVLFAGNNRTSQQILMASAGLLLVVGIVLAIACSNVANLLLARAANRQQEIGIRMALGASRWRLVRQLLTESVFLAIVSGTAGLVVAYAALRVLFGVLPSSANFVAPKLDLTVFLFALLVSLATGLLFGIVPALKSSRANLAEALKEETRTSGRSRRKITVANILLAGQIAFSFLLLMTATLFLRSIGHAYEIDPGFQTAHLVIFLTNPGQAGLGRAETKAFYKDGLERVARMPGVEAVSWASDLPLWTRPVSGLEIAGEGQRSRSDQISTIVNTISPGYFDASGIALEKGRQFGRLDRAASTPVAIVNEKLASQFWPHGEALGKQIRLAGETQLRQIVGIARTANYTDWAEKPQFCVYVPLEQNYSDGMNLYVRSRGDTGQLIGSVRQELRTAAPHLMVNVLTGQRVVEGGLFFARTGVTLLGVFGLLALGLASIGLYGIVAYSVGQRTREIGLRMALGAGPGSVVAMVLRQGMSMVLVGVLIGLAGGLTAGKLLSKMLYGVSAADPLSVAGAVAVLSAVALLACYLPAKKASRIDPVVALREG